MVANAVPLSLKTTENYGKFRIVEARPKYRALEGFYRLLGLGLSFGSGLGSNKSNTKTRWIRLCLWFLRVRERSYQHFGKLTSIECVWANHSSHGLQQTMFAMLYPQHNRVQQDYPNLRAKEMNSLSLSMTTSLAIRSTSKCSTIRYRDHRRGHICRSGYPYFLIYSCSARPIVSTSREYSHHVIVPSTVLCTLPQMEAAKAV